MDRQHLAKGKEDDRMAVSKAIVPMLQGNAAKSLMKTLECSKIKPYSDDQRKETKDKVEELLAKRKKR